MIKLIDVQKHWVSFLMSRCYLKSLFIASNSPFSVENTQVWELSFAQQSKWCLFSFSFTYISCYSLHHFSFILFFLLLFFFNSMPFFSPTHISPLLYITTFQFQTQPCLSYIVTFIHSYPYQEDSKLSKISEKTIRVFLSALNWGV